MPRSITQMRFPVHRDMAGFDFDVSPVDRKLVSTLAATAFTDDAHNVVLVGGPGTGKTHLATAIGVSGITGQCVGAGEGSRQGRAHRVELSSRSDDIRRHRRSTLSKT